MLRLQHIGSFYRHPLKQIGAAKKHTGEKRQAHVSHTLAATQLFSSGDSLNFSARCALLSAKTDGEINC